MNNLKSVRVHTGCEDTLLLSDLKPQVVQFSEACCNRNSELITKGSFESQPSPFSSQLLAVNEGSLQK